MNIVFFSGGIGSAAATLRLLDCGVAKEEIVLLFADTRIEDPDLYRFIEEFSNTVGLRLEIVADGRTPQQVFKDKRWLGNSRLAQCSHVLKQDVCRKWVQENCSPELSQLVIGIDWSEIHRLPKSAQCWQPFKLLAPLCDPPYLDKIQCAQAIVDAGVKIPVLYSQGFSHNNCGGGCVRAGKAQWRNLLRKMPERFEVWESHEVEMQNLLGKPVTILKDMSLAELRKIVEAENRIGIQLDLFDLGGCGCFVGD